ncbi:hypothetical protein Sps_02466 [Shewanella psychrophila]|uniref:Uncharacterized protein n=1 Tax=Shewanella psychrophila TaxID=225848 RepID=A0A1S6HQ08_9GAMM|nr:hypothetical protein [Shewanella psychrophila]AQS37620.1 hypothetical protein Sps_02466 [Shewanella psychrophila]
MLTIYKSGNQLDSISISQADESKTISSAKGISIDEAKQQALTSARMFEAGTSMNILNKPGSAGLVIDKYAKTLEKTIENIDKKGDQHKVVFNNKEMTIKELFHKQFGQMSSDSDQIGRQSKTSDKPLIEWLTKELKTPIGELNHSGMLTKIKSLSVFGTTVWQLMTPPEGNRPTKSSDPIENKAKNAADFSANRDKNIKALNSVLRGVCSDVAPLYKEFTQKTRTKAFDDPLTRARSERMPMVEDEKGQLKPVEGKYEDAAKYGLGFGQVVQRVHDKNSLEQKKLSAALNDNKNINGIPRENAPIQDLNRPYMMSEDEIKSIPQGYKDLGIEQGIKAHELNHGTGVNRWQPYGVYALESTQQGLPFAGAQSGGTCDILLAATVLSGNSLYSNPKEVMPLTLGAAAFMNYGGYHTFNEVLPIGEAMSSGKPFVPSNRTERNKTELYDRVQSHARKYLPPITEQNISSYKQVHTGTINELKQQHKSLSFDLSDFGNTTFYNK